MIEPTAVRVYFNGEQLGQFAGGHKANMFNRAHRQIREQFFLDLKKPAKIEGVVIFGDHNISFQYEMTAEDHPRRIEREILKGWFLDRDSRVQTHNLGYNEIQVKFLKTELGVK